MSTITTRAGKGSPLTNTEMDTNLTNLNTDKVEGPASSTDNAITRFDSTTGKVIQNSLVTVADDGAITAPSVGSVIPFYFANQAAFPSATTYHGALAHSHSDGKVYFAHSSSWNALANASELPTLGTGVATFLATPSSANLASALTDESGSSTVAFTTSPTFVTPTLGVASATTVNKVTLTTPATGSTLTVADGKTLTASNTLTFTGTDTSSVAFGTGGTVAYLGANTFTAAQEWASGTAIASASTINLNTATGNRVHITGTTAITAVTLTRGPRTVIFDGILTLTHHATTNNLPGAANITTAAGDRAIYESDGTTVYCVSYIKASGASVVAAAGGFSEMSVYTSSTTFTIPSGKTTLKVTVVGAGGGGGSSGGVGSAGGNTTLASGTQTISTITGNGGSAGAAANGSGGAGGSSSGGTLNTNGGGGGGGSATGYVTGGAGGSSIFGGGARGVYPSAGEGGSNYGGGGGGGSAAFGSTPAAGGGGGGTAIKFLTGLTPGNTLTVTIGAGGAGGAVGTANGGAGSDGAVIIEY